MPDMSMCKGNKCPLRETCYRYKAVANVPIQSYIDSPYNVREDKCDFYWPTKILQDGKDNTRI
jgi:hypothetical protein